MKIDILPRRLFRARAAARVLYRASLSKEIVNCFGQSGERERERETNRGSSCLANSMSDKNADGGGEGERGWCGSSFV